MTEQTRILYRGAPMIEGWPEKIKAAQDILSYRLNGQDVPRVRYGNQQSELHADKKPCHDCGVIKGEFHVPDCGVEECPSCGGQLLSCDCPFDHLMEDEISG